MNQRLGFWLGMLGLLGACEGEGRTKEPPGLHAPDGTPLAQPVPAASQPNRLEAREPDPFESSPSFAEPSAWDRAAAADLPSSSPPPSSAAPPIADSAGSAQAGTLERDLPAELAAVLEPPANCVDLARVAQTGGRLEIRVEAMVMPSGRINRATVSAPHQAPEALRCLEARLLSGSLAGDVPGAPIRIEAIVPVEVVAQRPTPAAPSAAPPIPTPRPSSGDEVARPDGTEFARPSE